MKKILILAAAMVAFVSCKEAAAPDYYFDQEVTRLYNDPNAEFDTLSYAAGMNAGLVISIQNADFGLDTETVIAKLDKELKILVTDQDKFDETNDYLSKYSTERVRPFMMAKKANARVVTDRPDTLSLPALFDETYTHEAFTEALVTVFADGMRKQRLPVNLHWVYKAMRDAVDVKTKEDIDAVMALTEQNFMQIMGNYTQVELPAYNKELTEAWFERVAAHEVVKELTNEEGEPTGLYYRINHAGGETKPVNETDSIAVKYEVYSRTGKLLESNEQFVKSLKKQREQLGNNKLLNDSMRQVYYDQIDAEIKESALRRLPLNRFMTKDIQNALKLVGDGGNITIWLDANKAFGFRASRVLPINEGVVVNVELVEVKTIKPTPKPVSNMVVPNKGIVKEKVAPQGRAAQKPTIIPVQQK